MTTVPRQPRPARGAVPAAVAASTGICLFAVLGGVVPGGRGAAAVVYAVVVVSSVFLLIHRTRRIRSGRGAWELLVAGIVVLVVCQGLLMAASTGDGGGVGISLTAFEEHPAVALSGLLAYPLLYAGQMSLLRQRVQGLLPSAWLDGVLISIVILALLSAFIIPMMRSDHGLTAASALALAARPALDTLMGAFAIANWALSGWRSDRRLPLVAGAFITLCLSDTLGVLRITRVVDIAGADVAANTGRLCALVLLVVAVGLDVPPPDGRRLERDSHLIAPALVMIISGALLVVDDQHDLGPLPVYLCVTAYAGVGIKFAVLYREVLRLVDSRRQALTDDLTGLANRRALREELQRAEAATEAVSLLVVDLDGFKDVNDRHGHATGDALLRHAARCLTSSTPSRALLARTGGDEFAVLLAGLGVDGALVVAGEVVEGLSARATVNGRPLSAAASVGVVTRPAGSDDHLDAAELMRRADVAMYLAKAAGGGLAVYDEDVDAAARERARLLDELRVALDGGATPSLHHQDPATEQIHAHYQPQVDIRTGAVIGVEALVRWNHPRLGLLTPDVFLGLVEEHGLMAAVTTRVLWSAAEQTVRWHEAGHPLRLAVNLSASCLSDPAFLVLLDEVLLSTGLEPADLVVEITETTLMTDPAAALCTTREITARGVGLSIDDYGTGYSSMAYLNDLPATELKLDRTFTSRLLSDERTAAIAATAIDLAHRLGMRMIAEGVEDAATVEALRELGCDETQGYHHSRPLTALAMGAWLLGDTAAAHDCRGAVQRSHDHQQQAWVPPGVVDEPSGRGAVGRWSER